MDRVLTIAYVDGFNLYFRALRRPRLLWLNIEQLIRELLPNDDVVRIKYFTARVDPSPFDPGQHVRQQIYLRALATLPSVDVVFGHYITKRTPMPLAAEWAQGKLKMVHVMKTEEKGSDVNVATHMLCDAASNAYEMAALISSDSDLEGPLRAVRDVFGKRVALLNPAEHVNQKLKAHSHVIKNIRKGLLRKCQFPRELSDQNGSFHRPPQWD